MSFFEYFTARTNIFISNEVKEFNMKNKSHKPQKAKTQNGILVSIAIGIFSVLIIFFALISLFSCITVNMKNPHKFLLPLSFFAIYTSSFFGGFIATKKNNSHDALLCGTLVGVISTILLCLLFLIIGMIFNTQSTPLSWLFRALNIIFSVFGSLIASKKRKTPKTIHKHRKK